jgi:two-component system sensor histidine kinase BaeS
VRLAPAPVDLSRELCGWIDQARPLAEQKRIILRCETPETAALDADPVILGRAIANLLANAIRFTPFGGDILIRLITAEDILAIEVCDSGPGIPPADRERVFGRFVQLDPARSRHSGFGLGLPIARWAVALHGGTLTLESNQPTGCRACIRLPRRTA